MVERKPAVRVVAVLVLLGSLSGVAKGQDAGPPVPSDDEMKMAELVQRIRKGLETVDRNLDSAARMGGSEKREDLGFLLDETRRKQRKIIDDINELIRSIKVQKSPGGGGGERERQPQDQDKKKQEPRSENPGDDELKKNLDRQKGESPEDRDPAADKGRQKRSRRGPPGRGGRSARGRT